MPSRKYEKNKKDANHDDIVDMLEGAGLGVKQTWRFGHGYPDIVVHGYNHITERYDSLHVEIKSSENYKLTEAEEKWHSDFTGPLIVAWNAEMILSEFGRI
jgi:hypothetical protein